MELKRHETLVEVVPDTETFRFWSWLFSFLLWDKNGLLLRSSCLVEEVPLLISVGVVNQLESVIDVAKKTIECRNFRNAQVPLGVVAGHLMMHLKPKHASVRDRVLQSFDRLQ